MGRRLLSKCAERLPNTVQTRFRRILERLQKNVADTRAVILSGPDGVVDYLQIDSSLDIETIAAECGTLLRIAGSTSEDTGAGNLIEYIVVSDKSIMISRNVPPDHSLILFSRTQEQVGRGRYELKLAAREIQRHIST